MSLQGERKIRYNSFNLKVFVECDDLTRSRRKYLVWKECRSAESFLSATNHSESATKQTEPVTHDEANVAQGQAFQKIIPSALWSSKTDDELEMLLGKVKCWQKNKAAKPLCHFLTDLDSSRHVSLSFSLKGSNSKL